MSVSYLICLGTSVIDSFRAVSGVSHLASRKWIFRAITSVLNDYQIYLLHCVSLRNAECGRAILCCRPPYHSRCRHSRITFSPNPGDTFHPHQELISRPINGECASPELRQWYTHEWHMTATLDVSGVSINQDKYTCPKANVSSKGHPRSYP